MGCSCHDPAVFGHLSCELAPREHPTEPTAHLLRAGMAARAEARSAETMAALSKVRAYRDRAMEWSVSFERYFREY